MTNKIILTLSVAATAALFSACGAPAANTTNSNANKSATNTNAAANTANTNTAAANTTAASATDGQVIKLEEAGIMMTVPKGFKFSKDGEDTIVQTEDEGVDIRFTVPKDGDYDKIIAAAAEEIDSYLNDVKVVDKGSKIMVDGMEGTSLSGTAKNEGEDVSWDLTVIKAPKKPVLANIYAAKSSMEKHGADVKKFFASIKKM